MLAAYYEQNENGTIASSALSTAAEMVISEPCAAGRMQDTAPQIPDSYTLVLPVKDHAGNEGLCVYQYFAP